MKKSNLKTIVITGMLIAVGAFALHRSMVYAQNIEIQSDITEEKDVIDTTQGEEAIETKENGMTTYTYTWNSFTINFNVIETELESTLNQEVQDMDPKDAFEIALNKLETIYQIELQGNTIEMILKINDVNENCTNLKNANVRYYDGFINDSSGITYSFWVNSVTGEILFIGKFNSEQTDLNNESILYDLYTKEEMANVKDDYYNIAEEFVNQYIDKGNVIKVYGICAGQVQNRISMRVYCETIEGDTILIDIDQETKEVLVFEVNPTYM